MCFDLDARPPDLPSDLALRPIGGGAGAELLELTSADGTRFSAALAQSPEAGGPGVVILPDVRGLYPFYSELAARFAQAGHHAVTIDYFGRTAGLGPRDEEFDYRPHVSQTTVEQVQADVKAAIVELEERTEVTGVVAVGFCFGGMQAFLAATSPSLGLDAVIGFYAGLDTAERYGFPGRCSAPMRSAGRSWACSAGPTRASLSSRCACSSASSATRTSSARSRSTRARPTRSSTAPTLSTPTPAKTPGGVCLASSDMWGRADAVARVRARVGRRVAGAQRSGRRAVKYPTAPDTST